MHALTSIEGSTLNVRVEQILQRRACANLAETQSCCEEDEARQYARSEKEGSCTAEEGPAEA
jgi:hypothetical protein